jgi:hypothetical protein
MSEFKRPAGVSDDPEASYRAGYQHGAWAVFERVRTHIPAEEQVRFEQWIEGDLQQWRHDRARNPAPPIFRRV